MTTASASAVRAAVIPAPGKPIEIRTYPEPIIEPGGAILKILAAEVCGTDVHLWHGRLAGVPYPLIPGHVSVGEIVATGGDLTDVEGRPIRVGDVVTFLDVHGTCNACVACSVWKTSTRCPHRRVYGITFGAEDGLLGGWSELLYLKPGTKILPLAKNVTPEQWIGGGCGLPTAVHAIELAEVVGARHVLVDKERTTVPISGTKMRADPLGNWEYLPECVRPYYVRRILLYGPESTGKTTLAGRLANHYVTAWVPEFARTYLDVKVTPCTYEDISFIAGQHREAEEWAARCANRLLFCDTDAITTTIYSHHFFRRCPHWVQRLADERRYDLVLFCDIDLPWEADPAHRDSPHRREEFRDRFLNELHSRRIPFVTIRGIGDSRLQAAIDAVEAYLRSYRENIAARSGPL